MFGPISAARAQSISNFSFRIFDSTLRVRIFTMVGTTIPLVFKPLTPYIRRAEELDRDETRVESRLIAYYCRQYAMERGIELRGDDSSDEATTFLLTLMDNLEKEKASMPEFSKEEGKQICQSFAEEIFQKADDEDRAGASTKYVECTS